MELTLFAANLFVIFLLLAGVGMTLFGLPGNLIILITAVGYGFFENFVTFETRFLLGLGGIFLLGEAVEFLAGALGAKKAKASGRAIVAAFFGGLAGAVFGSVIMPVAGTLAGAVAGAFGLSYLAELSKTGDKEKSARVARNVAVGLLVGTLFKLAVAVGMAAAVVLRLPWS